MCGEPNEHVLQEATAEYLQHMAEIGETIREGHFIRQAFSAGLQIGVKAFISRGLSQVAACDGKTYSSFIGNTNHEAQGNFLPLF